MPFVNIFPIKYPTKANPSIFPPPVNKLRYTVVLIFKLVRPPHLVSMCLDSLEYRMRIYLLIVV